MDDGRGHPRRTALRIHSRLQAPEFLMVPGRDCPVPGPAQRPRRHPRLHRGKFTISIRWRRLPVRLKSVRKRHPLNAKWTKSQHQPGNCRAFYFDYPIACIPGSHIRQKRRETANQKKKNRTMSLADSTLLKRKVYLGHQKSDIPTNHPYYPHHPGHSPGRNSVRQRRTAHHHRTTRPRGIGERNLSGLIHDQCPREHHRDLVAQRHRQGPANPHQRDAHVHRINIVDAVAAGQHRTTKPRLTMITTISTRLLSSPQQQPKTPN